MKKKTLLVSSFIILTFMLGVFGFNHLHGESAMEPIQEPQLVAPSQDAKVSAVYISEGNLTESIEAADLVIEGVVTDKIETEFGYTQHAMVDVSRVLKGDMTYEEIKVLEITSESMLDIGKEYLLLLIEQGGDDPLEFCTTGGPEGIIEITEEGIEFYDEGMKEDFISLTHENVKENQTMGIEDQRTSDLERLRALIENK